MAPDPGTPAKRPAGRRPLIAGLACIAAASTWLVVIHPLRKGASDRGRAPAAARKPVARLPEGPPMRIAAADRAGAGREREDNALRMKFRWCPPGTFHMGRLPERYRRFEAFAPVAAVLRRGFWMGRYEVTQAQWRQVMGLSLREQRARDPAQPRPLGDGSTRDHVGEGPDHPIYFTSYDESEEFCRRLTESEREAGRLDSGWEYRLPTETQWEYACRAGTTTATSFGDALDASRANFDGGKPFGDAPAGPYLHETTPVGRYPANPWGLQDMHGNVWEWCRDAVATPPVRGAAPRGKPRPPQRIYRGGCWHNGGDLCLSTTRAWGDADGRGSGRGFRVALVPPGR